MGDFNVKVWWKCQSRRFQCQSMKGVSKYEISMSKQESQISVSKKEKRDFNIKVGIRDFNKRSQRVKSTKIISSGKFLSLNKQNTERNKLVKTNRNNWQRTYSSVQYWHLKFEKKKNVLRKKGTITDDKPPSFCELCVNSSVTWKQQSLHSLAEIWNNILHNSLHKHWWNKEYILIYLIHITVMIKKLVYGNLLLVGKKK